MAHSRQASLLAGLAFGCVLFVSVHAVPLMKASDDHEPSANFTGRAFVVNSTSEVDANSTSRAESSFELPDDGPVLEMDDDEKESDPLKVDHYIGVLEEKAASDLEREARNLNQQPNVRFIDPLDLVRPVAGLINGDFGVGLVAPSIPGFKPDDNKLGVDPNLLIASASSKFEPAIAPFRPFAMHFTAATPADLSNLRPNYDLVYPFLDPPKNVLFAKKDEKKDDKDKDKFTFRQTTDEQEMFAQASRLTPEQLAVYQQAVEQWKAQQQRSAGTERFLPIGFGAGGGFGSSAGFGAGPLGVGSGFGFPSFGPGATSAFAAATVPVNPFVKPFYPFAAGITGASLSDFTNLRPHNDLVFPFLNQPYNTLLQIQSDKDKKDKDKNKFDFFRTTTPQQVAAMVKSLAEAKKNGSNSRDFSTFPLELLLGSNPVPNPVTDPLGTLVALDNLQFRPLSHLVYPFLPADKNPALSLLYYLTPNLRNGNQTITDNPTSRFLPIGAGFGGIGSTPDFNGLDLKPDFDGLVSSLGGVSTPSLDGAPINPFSDLILPFLPTDTMPLLSLLYYITPFLSKTQQRMATADKMIASALSARQDLSPVEAVAHARELQGIVAATELHHTLKSLGLGDVSAPLLKTFYPQMSAPTNRQFLGALGFDPAESVGDFFDDVGDLFDNDKDKPKKLGHIPGAAPILHYFYPYLPKRVLKPFKPLVDKRLFGTKSGIFGDVDFDDISDLFDGGKDKPKKLGHIPGAAPILHYFYPNLPKRVLKPFRPLVDKRMAAIVSRVNNEVNQRLFELKYAAAVAAMKQARFQQRLLESMAKVGRRNSRQCFNTDDEETAIEEEGEEPETVPEEDGAESADELGEESSSSDFGQNQSVLSQLFRFFVPDVSKMEQLVKGSNRDARSLMDSRELSGEAGLPAALDFIQNAVDDHAPFPLNDIFKWWTNKRGFATRTARSVDRPSFNESFSALRLLQKRSLALNDTIAVQFTRSNSTREGRNLGDLFGLGGGSFLPFPFNLLSSFLPFRGGVRAEDESEAGFDGEEEIPESMDSEYDTAFEESGVSAQEGDRRMASMIGPFMPEPLNALVAGLFPFRSFEQDLEQESNIEDGTGADANSNSEERTDEAMKAFKDSLQAIREEYLNKQDSSGAQQAAEKAQDLAAQAMSSFR